MPDGRAHINANKTNARAHTYTQINANDPTSQLDENLPGIGIGVNHDEQVPPTCSASPALFSSPLIISCYALTSPIENKLRKPSHSVTHSPW